MATTLQFARVTLSQAQILACATTPVPVIPAPGAGKMVQIVASRYRRNAAAPGYFGAVAPGLYYGSGDAGPSADGGDGGVFEQTGDCAYTSSGSGLLFSPLLGVENQPIVYSMSSGAFVGGTGGGNIEVAYFVSDV